MRSNVGLLLVCAVAGGRALADAPDADALRQRYSGQWRFIGGAAERDAVPAAVERSVDGMFFISRGIAYDRLIKVCEICRTINLSFEGGQVTVASPCQLSDVSPQDGSEVEHTTKHGDTSKLSQRFLDGALVQDFRGEEGARRVVWTVQPDQVSLSVHVTISSKHLPHPVDYTLSYRRASAASSSLDAGPPDAGRPAD
jgi:hypothetical protein